MFDVIDGKIVLLTFTGFEWPAYIILRHGFLFHASREKYTEKLQQVMDKEVTVKNVISRISISIGGCFVFVTSFN